MANARGDVPLRSKTLTLAPALTKEETICQWPFKLAKCKAVLAFWLALFSCLTRDVRSSLSSFTTSWSSSNPVFVSKFEWAYIIWLFIYLFIQIIINEFDKKINKGTNFF